jgi:hypothetical protein
MIIDISKLENCKTVGNKIIARCPACQELGQDTKGNHLVIYEDGRFGCVAYPSNSGQTHRKRIFQLVGILKKTKLKITIKEASPKSHNSNNIIIKNVLGHLGRYFSSCLEKQSFYEDKKIESLTKLYLEITEVRKVLQEYDKLSAKDDLQNNNLISLEDYFSSKWNKLDESTQKMLFEVLCEKGLVPNIIKQTVDVFNARVVSLV